MNPTFNDQWVGVHPSIPNDDYHSGPGVSKSGLWSIHTKSPAHFKFAPREEKNHFAIGEAGHIAVLEPDTFEARVMKGPADRRGNAWKDAQAEANNSDRLLLTEGDYDKALLIRDVIHANALVSAIIRSAHSQIEHSAYWVDEETGVLCRCRPDLYRPDLGLMLDLKTTTDAHPDAFARSVVNYGYHSQEAFYADGLRALGQPVAGVLFLAVEKTDPFVFGLYELPPSIVAEGREIMRKSLDVYRACEQADHWPGYCDGVRELSFKRWAYQHTEFAGEEA